MASHNPWQVKKVALSPPSLASLAEAIASGLSSNFAVSSCSMATPPDLTAAPYHLAGPGLGGSTRIVDVGGPPNLAPSPNLTKKYDLAAIARQVDMSPSTGFLLGAGAGPFYVLGQNSELMPNFAYGTAAGQGGGAADSVRNRTHYAKITAADTVCCAPIPQESTGFAFMCNLFCSDGVPCECLHVTARSRSGPLNFTATIQHALQAAFGDKLISLGGVFLINKGTAKLHVMPDFPTQPFTSRADVDRWLRYFDMSFAAEEPPLVCLSVLHSGHDGGLALRMEHTHCFTVSPEGVAAGGNGDRETTKGGHYHYDLDETRDEIEYEGWFNVAELLYRVDQPGS
ncbi:uncharacterized protein Z520_12169 [Fonsecaea multimorphosa CBS 102226]|uniref:DUF1907 domain-containing protein n=1 Tax=Fonsecaea multimorphosa CBS 102226 TaxID=1442371 RepID=A0A0D2GRC5_9EURO|nr:uncharacterized protein Z520_12169 [Fonsecaea multimorphosa CBS 102226]KIX92085.1 hypothetical protein Z520_12169 [Fonsecaea multimorphosa CBS 102226]OAL17451.1 hypothetical protein AYO22_11583 [Fonsecaea multimorphosa]